MKKLPVLAIMMLLFSCSHHKKTSIGGEFLNIPENTYVFLDEVNVSRNVLMDSCKINSSGRFRFSFRIEEPTFFQLRLSPNIRLTILAEPGEKIKLAGSWDSLPGTYTIAGSPESEWIKNLNTTLTFNSRKLDSLAIVYKSLPDGKDAAEERNVLEQQYAGIIKAQKKSTIQFLITHYNSMASILALYQKFNDSMWVMDSPKETQYFKIVSDSLGKRYPTSNHVKALKADLNQKLAEHKAMVLQSMALNAPVGFPDIALPDRHGELVHLNKLSGKVILLNFWISTSPQCLMLNRDYADLYKKFRNTDFEIYSVSLDQNKEKWMSNLSETGNNWIQVWDESGTSSRAASLYNIKELPASFLISKNGDIIGKNLDLPTLGKKIAEWIKK